MQLLFAILATKKTVDSLQESYARFLCGGFMNLFACNGMTCLMMIVQYERIFDTTRIPGKDTDMLLHYEDVQKYVAVSRRVS